MTRSHAYLLVLMLLGCGCRKVVDPQPAIDAPPAIDPVTSSVVDALSGTQNPNGVWTLGFAATAEAVLTPFSHLVNGPDTPTWTDESPYMGGVHGIIWKNATSAPRFGVAPGQISAHPGATGELAIIRYTAPFTGTFTAHVEALEGDVGATSASVRVRGVARHSANTPTSYDLPATDLASGDTIELWVGSLGDWSADNTPVVLTVTGTPGR